MKTLMFKALVLSAGLGFAGLATVSDTPQGNQLAHLYTQRSTPVANPDLPAFALKGIDWLVSVQFENGGWGAGLHSAQHIRDAREVQIDPGTTAFAALALIRTGSTLTTGKYAPNIQRATNYLLQLVEECPENQPYLTNIRGTQPQVKLGQNIDASLAAQFFLRLEPLCKHDNALQQRVAAATEKCLRKIQQAQSADGSVQGGGWAPVLQSAMANNALEIAYNSGKNVDKKALDRARKYQKQNLDDDGKVRSERGAGVALYSVAGNQRATATEAREAEEVIVTAKKKGKIAPTAAPPTRDQIVKLAKEEGKTDEEAKSLADSYTQNQATARMMNDDRILQGFGNNGGEEFLSFMLTTEALVITGGDAWTNWKQKMEKMLQDIQNGDGSWNGHHCITSPVFCTAAVILALSAENDKDLLIEKANKKK